MHFPRFFQRLTIGFALSKNQMQRYEKDFNYERDFFLVRLFRFLRAVIMPFLWHFFGSANVKQNSQMLNEHRFSLPTKWNFPRDVTKISTRCLCKNIGRENLHPGISRFTPGCGCVFGIPSPKLRNAIHFWKTTRYW